MRSGWQSGTVPGYDRSRMESLFASLAGGWEDGKDGFDVWRDAAVAAGVKADLRPRRQTGAGLYDANAG